MKFKLNTLCCFLALFFLVASFLLSSCQRRKCESLAAQAEIDILLMDIPDAAVRQVEVTLKINDEEPLQRTFNEARPSFVFSFADWNRPPYHFTATAVALDADGKTLGVGQLDETFRPDGCNLFTVLVRPPSISDGGADSGHETCPTGLKAPVIQSFTTLDQKDAVALNAPVKLVVKTIGDPRVPLQYGYQVAPSADPVKNNRDGTAEWRLTAVPLIYFTTTYTITAEIRYACSGGPAPVRADLQVKVWGNVLVSVKGVSTASGVEAIGSNGSYLGPVLEKGLQMDPTGLLLLNKSELAVGDFLSGNIIVFSLLNGNAKRQFGGGISSNGMDYLDRLPAGDVLSGFSGDAFYRFSQDGVFLQKIVAPDGSARGLAHLTDGTILTGKTSSGKIYAFHENGQLKGLFSDLGKLDWGIHSLLVLENEEVLVSGRYDGDYYKIFRLSKQGQVLTEKSIKCSATSPPVNSIVSLRRFADGYLFLPDASATRCILRINSDLQPDASPYYCWKNDALLHNLIWLDSSL
jgi:hypothetical protein